MNYQMLLLGLAGLCVLLFLVQWICQARHTLHGGTRPLAQTHPVVVDQSSAYGTGVE